MTDITQTQFTFAVSLTPKAHQLAEKFCEQHFDLQKSEQVYLNTLSIYAVNHYLKCLGFETDWAASNSYDVVMQTFLDTADLVVKNHGKLECRSVLQNMNFVYIPPETWTSRVGYIAVQLDESLQTATLLGFTPRVTTEELPLKQLRALEEFPQYLQQTTPSINLNEWFEGFLQAGWQTLESLLSNEFGENLNLNFKDASNLQQEETIEAVKQVIFENQSVMLLLVLLPESNEQVSIRIRVYPDSKQNCLPENLKLAILTDSEETLRVVSARPIDNFIQLPRFQCNPQESFIIQLSLNGMCFKESFYLSPR